MPNKGEGWSDWQLKTFHEMYAQGIVLRLIAEKIGKTRNSIAGKVHRLKLERLSVVPKKVAVPKKIAKIQARPEVRPEARPKKVIEPMISIAPIPTKKLIEKPNYSTIDTRVGLLDLTDNHCRSVLDIQDERNHPLFCGHPTLHGSPWCREHHELFTTHLPKRTHKPFIFSNRVL